MPFNSSNNIYDYWYNKIFSGREYFNNILSRDMFNRVNDCLKLNQQLETKDYHNNFSTDPLCHYRTFMNRCIFRITQVAVLYGSSVFEKSIMIEKFRMRSRTYMLNKPSKYGITLYSFLSRTSSCLFFFFDNGSDKFLPVPAYIKYNAFFRELKCLLKKLFKEQ